MKAMTLTRVIRIGSVTCRESLSTCADRSGPSFEIARVTERKRERERERERTDTNVLLSRAFARDISYMWQTTCTAVRIRDIAKTIRGEH